LELEYKGICWDQMQKIQDFQKKKGWHSSHYVHEIGTNCQKNDDAFMEQ
jgi:hypothetical protein